MRPRILPGLLEQHDDVLHVSVKMGVERYAEEVEMEAWGNSCNGSKNTNWCKFHYIIYHF